MHWENDTKVSVPCSPPPPQAYHSLQKTTKIHIPGSEGIAVDCGPFLRIKPEFSSTRSSKGIYIYNLKVCILRYIFSYSKKVTIRIGCEWR